MIGIIIASHGKFAEGLLNSGEMMFGPQENLETVCFMPEEGPEDLKNNLLEALNKFDSDQEVLFLVDLWGGSPFNQASLLYEENKNRTAIVTGMNLPLLLEALGGRMMEKSVHALAEKLMDSESIGVRVLPEKQKEEVFSSDEATTKETSEVSVSESADDILPPGTVLGDGKVEYVLCRVDTRLLHGQVSTNWVKQLKPDRIWVVSDTVIHDDMRKSLIQQASPSGVRTHIIPLSKLVEVDKDPRFGNTKALLLFENPQDVLKVMKKGVEFETVNLGSMAHTEGKTLLTNALSVDQKDVDTLKEIQSMGAKLDIRKVPADTPENFEVLVKKHGFN